jgi:hypothetical protein
VKLEDLDAEPEDGGAVLREVPAPVSKPPIEIGSGPETIRALTEAINDRELPETYVSNGRVVHVEKISGSAAVIAGDDDSPLPVTASEVGPASLAGLLADHTFTYRTKTRKDAKGKQEAYEEEATPGAQSLAAALARKTWPGLLPLHGIVGAPVLRPDGTLLQEPAYDERTGFYLASKIPLELVPSVPAAQQVRKARKFLLEEFLHDFPWVDDADRANYLGVLVTPILRPYLRALTPFVVYTATMPGSGKTILTCGPGMLYGQRVLTWTHSDEELRKSITAVLAEPVGTIIFDNLAEGTVIDSPVLARLITDRTWADRLLGGNKIGVAANDRLWSATGNNLLLGGDMATRTVLVRLNPDMPHPEERTGFTIPNLDQWILNPANQRRVLWHLLILVIDWTGNGAPRQAGITMRQFTPWAEAIGGFLAHHDVGGFLANIQTVRDIDEDNATWTAFLGRWRKLCGDNWRTSKEIRRSADVPEFGEDLWDGLYLTDGRGKPLNEVALGKRLKSQVGRYHGPYVLRSNEDRHNHVRTWRVEEFAGNPAVPPENPSQPSQPSQQEF